MKLKLLIGLALFGLIVLSDMFFIVQQTQQAIVLQFGKPVTFRDNGKEVSSITTPGLKVKMPFVQEVKFFDKRILTFEATDKETLDLDKKNLTVNAFAKYQIIDPLRFYESVTDERGINDRMDRIFESSLRDAIGKIPLSTILTKDRTKIINDIRDEISAKAANFGIKVFDVRIVRADLPQENSTAIYQRMRTEREKEAREYRAQGEEQAQVIRSKADKEVRILVADARRKALIMRGEGDAIAAKTYADAYNRDPEFFGFYRTMQSYGEALDKEKTTMVLSPDSELLKYMKGTGTPSTITP